MECPSIGARTTITHLREDLCMLTGYMEGPADVLVVRWGAKASYEVLLRHVTQPDVVAADGRLRIKSACNPLTGRPEGRYAGGDTCAPRSETCGYCERMYGIAVDWTWSPGERPQRKAD